MKSGFSTYGAALLTVAALAACGGGGGGGGGGTPPVISTSAPIVTPTPAPTLNPFGCVGSTPSAASVARGRLANPPHPIASGDTFAYAGTLAATFTQSAPCAEPTATSAATVTVNVTDSATSPPAGATDSTSVESDAYALQTISITTHQTVANTASAFNLYETTSSDTSGNSVKTVYVSPQMLDKLPETQGDQWSNQPAATLTETLADGTSVTRNTKNDGSYVDTEHFVNNTTGTITVNGQANGTALDGGGTYTLTVVGDTAPTTFSYAPPAGGSITLTITTGSSSKTRTFPAWFTVPAAYITDGFVDNGAQPFDPQCPTAAAISASGDHQIVETYSVLDPVLGYTDTRTTTSYVVDGFGAACVKIADTLSSYYDYKNDTTKIDYQSQNGQPNSVDTIIEYLGMTSPVSPLPALRTQSVRPVSPISVARAADGIIHTRNIQAAQQLRELYRYASRLARKGGAQ